MAQLQLDDINADFIVRRKNELEGHWATEYSRMNTFEDLYLLDVWKGVAAKGQRRVASPRAFNIVEGFSTLMLTQPPIISVPRPHLSREEDRVSETIEKYLLAVWYTMRLLVTAELAETYACALGKGVMRLVYDDQAPRGDFPLVATEIDPRNYFHWPDVRRPDRDVEVAHTFDQKRRDVEAIWDIDWDESANEGGEAVATEDWLDVEVEVIDYWREVLVYEDEEDVEEEPEEEGLLERVARIVGERLGGAEETEEPEEDEEPERKPRPVRKIAHAVTVDAQLVHGPVFVPGYERLPFVRWGGYRTPFKDNEYLSVLFPIAGGANAKDDKKIGLVGAENDLLSIKLRIAEHYANSPWVTDSQTLGGKGLDTGLDALNVVEDGKKVWPLTNPGISPSVDNLMVNITDLADMATLPRSMQGAYVGEMSGVSMSALQNPMLMKAARLQRQREAAFEALNELILSLTEKWAESDGWTVYGVDKSRRTISVVVGGDDIDGIRQTSVQLAASLPQDVASHALMLDQLVKSKILSRRSAIDEMQRTARFPNQSVDDEMKRIMIEEIMLENELVRNAEAMKAVEEYDADLAARAQAAMGGQQGGPPGPVPQPQTGPGPLDGMPPQAIPPQGVMGALPPESIQGMEQQGVP